MKSYQRNPKSIVHACRPGMSWIRFLALATVLPLLVVSALWAQAGGPSLPNRDAPSSGQTVAGDATNSSSAGNTQRSQPPGAGVRKGPSPPHQPTRDLRQSDWITIRGRVVTESGGHPPMRVPVKMICRSSVARPQVWTDKEGRFVIEPGGEPLLQIVDASVAAPSMQFTNPQVTQVRGVAVGAAALRQCELFVDQQGYRSDRLLLPLDFSATGYDVGRIVLYRTKFTDSVTSQDAPRRVRVAYRKGVRAIRAKVPDFSQGIANLQRAVEEYPGFAAAWAVLGEARLHEGDNERAAEAFSRSIEADPAYLRPYKSMIGIAMGREDWGTVRSLAETYLSLSPLSLEVKCIKALATMHSGDRETANERIADLTRDRRTRNWPVCNTVIGLASDQR